VKNDRNAKKTLIGLILKYFVCSASKVPANWDYLRFCCRKKTPDFLKNHQVALNKLLRIRVRYILDKITE